MTEEVETQFEQIGILQLIRNMLSPRTLPHIIMIALISTILLFLVNTQEVFVAMAFISLSLSYTLIAALSNTPCGIDCTTTGSLTEPTSVTTYFSITHPSIPLSAALLG